MVQHVSKYAGSEVGMHPVASMPEVMPSRSRAVLAALLGLFLVPLFVAPADAAERRSCAKSVKDRDGDCIANTRDRDIDGDRIPNHRDSDMDGDRKRNSRDSDVDGDRVPNARDRQPFGVQVGGTRYGVAAPGRVRIARTTKQAVAGLPRGLRVPRAFLGVVAEDALAETGPAGAPAMPRIAASGVGLLRQTFSWRNIELRPGVLDFSAYDAFVADAARRGIDLLPILFDPPAFRSSAPSGQTRMTYPPASDAAFAMFAAILVARYGPTGSFWSARPDVPRRPIRAWQVWNEPNLKAYWGGKPDAVAYTRMLKTVHRAIRSVDPSATVVTAGLPESRLGDSPRRFLARMYRAGAKGHFQALALNPYATTADGVLEILVAMRRQMNKAKDRAAMWVTEIGWATTGTSSTYDLGEKAHAAVVTQTVALLARNAKRLNLRGVVYYAWRDLPVYEGGRDFWGLHTGLLSQDGTPKPAYRALTSLLRRLAR